MPGPQVHVAPPSVTGGDVPGPRTCRLPAPKREEPEAMVQAGARVAVPLRWCVEVAWSRTASECFAEAYGTFLLTAIGTMAVASAVLTDSLVGLWQVAAVWAVGVALAIYSTAHLSGAHLNPAVSLAFALLKPDALPWRRLVHYVAAQLVGAFAAGWATYGVYRGHIAAFETANGLDRGGSGSQRSAMVLCQYFPNPAVAHAQGPNAVHVDVGQAFFVEALGTFILVAVIFALNDPCNNALPQKSIVPWLIGFTVAALISVLAPLTQGSFNPARDFGPRLVAAALGWGSVALPGPQDGFWVYLVAPLVGGPLGALFTRFCLERHCAADEACYRPPPPSVLGDSDAGRAGSTGVQCREPVACGSAAEAACSVRV